MFSFLDTFPDLRVIALLAAAPLAWRIGQTIPARLGRISVVLSAGLSLFLASISDLWMSSQSGETLWPSVLQQSLVYLPLALSASLLVRMIRASREKSNTPQPSSQTVWLWSSLILLALIPAGVYRLARISQTTDRLQELQSQSRIGEFVALSQELITIAPAVSFQDQPLAEVLPPTELQLQSMTAALSQVQDRYQKGRLLAMLGRRDEALDVLDLDPSREENPAEVCLLAGTIYEHNADWSKSRVWYERARQQLKQSNSTKSSLWATAYRGLGFSHRKQGHNRAAEAAYLKLLELEPTAETHFLLAQFYENAQAGEKSAFHLQQAVALNAEKFRPLAADLKAKLQSHQFSCFQIWRD
ncbi:MAG: tetratricopeptide repeat protein [Planctomycetaceae bacterium]|nr:tetratricopeptide repeat protein [Planctomycetaceae bacterium]